jgi:hypothetical protein
MEYRNKANQCYNALNLKAQPGYHQGDMQLHQLTEVKEMDTARLCFNALT